MSGWVRPELLVEADWLQANLSNPRVRVVDTRWLAEHLGRSARADYLDGHIPGAVYVDWSTDLVNQHDPVRGKLAPADRFANLMGRLGIDNETTVVAYDDASGPFATRLWWALKYFGHDRVHVLNGGYTKWQAENRPISAGQAFHPARSYRTTERPFLRVERETVLASLGRPGIVILDARPEAQFAGREPSGTLRAGHIPGSVNVPVSVNFAADPPIFRSPDELAGIYRQAGVADADLVITTCLAGVASAGAFFALNLLGYDNVAVYDGSWAEWGNDPHLPIEH